MRSPALADSAEPIIACHECDALYERSPIPEGARADCPRCGVELYRHIPRSLDRSLALYLATLVLMIIANVFPFMSMETAGSFEENQVYSGGWALYEFGMGELGLVVFLTSILFPLITVVGMLYLLIPLRLGNLPIGHKTIFRLVKVCEPWSLLSVFMLGTLIAIVKLQSLASVLPGLGMFAFIAMLITFAAARVSFDPEIIWEKSAVAQLNSNQLSGGTPVINCHTCGLVRNHAGSEFMTESSVERITSPGMSVCERCGAAMHHRIVDSTERTAAFLLAAVTMLIPANLYPVMTVKTLGQGSPDTILSGVVRLIESGLWGLGMIVFVASIVVPCLKISVLSFLLYSVRYKPNWRPRDRTVLYRITEAIGAWSMVDVFLVGLLSGLVNLGLIASIRPGIGATFFAAAVILTIFAARSFDPRLIWDATGSEEATHWPMPQE